MERFCEQLPVPLENASVVGKLVQLVDVILVTVWPDGTCLCSLLMYRQITCTCLKTSERGSRDLLSWLSDLKRKRNMKTDFQISWKEHLWCLLQGGELVLRTMTEDILWYKEASHSWEFYCTRSLTVLLYSLSIKSKDLPNFLPNPMFYALTCVVTKHLSCWPGSTVYFHIMLTY